MSLLVRKPVIACSIIASSIIIASYLWLKHRSSKEDEEELPDAASTNSVPDLDQVQERLTTFKRHRLDTLEEEPAVQESTKDAVETVQEVTKESEVQEPAKTPVECHFACEDIRYKPGYKAKTKAEISKPDSTENKMAVEDAAVTVSSAQVPDVFSALNDPLCDSPGSPHHLYSSSPVKSDSAQSKSSCEWSDLIEQDEKELREFQLDSRELTCKLSGLEIDGGRSNDSGVASPSEEGETGDQVKQTKTRTSSGEDAGIGGSEQGDEATSDQVEDYQLLAYHFHIPEDLCGKLIGKKGVFINELKELGVQIHLKEIPQERKKSKRRKDYRRRHYYDEPEVKLCCVEGTRTNIDKCLTKLKEQFYDFPELTFEQVNRSHGSQTLAVHNGSVSLALAEGVMHDVLVSSIVGGGHVFLQQPCHPTYFALERLDQCMTNTYSQMNCPAIPQPVVLNSVCAVECEGAWYRCQIVGVHLDTETADVKYLDYGGYTTVPFHSLKQIRTDFLSLPFQAIECYLANIQPQDDENVSAFVLEELVSNQVVQARMIGTNEQGVPMIHLYRAVNGQTTMVNRELVDRSCATWLDTTIVKLDDPMDHPSVM